MSLFKKKPIIVEAVQWHAGDGKSLMRHFTGKDIDYVFDEW